MPFPLLAALPVVGQIASAIGQRRKEKRAEKRSTMEYERAIEDDRANYDRDRNNYLADRQHMEDYNSPLAERKRLEDAGLNPALIYGNASSAMGGTSDPQNAKGPSAPGSNKVDYENTVDEMDIAHIALAAEQQRMNRQNLEAELALKNAQTLAVLAGIDQTKIDTRLKQDTYDDLVRRAGLINDATTTDIEVKKKGMELTDTQIELNKIKASLTEQQILESKAKVQKMTADTIYTYDENKRQELQAKLDRAQTEEENKILVQEVLQEQIETKLKLAEQTNIPEKRSKLLAEVAILEYQKTHLVSSDIKDWVSILLGKSK